MLNGLSECGSILEVAAGDFSVERAAPVASHTMPSPTAEQVIQQRIGIRMRQARDRAGISGPAACEALGISRRTLHSWEDGAVAQPAHAVARMAELYRCSAEWLLAPDRTFFALVDPAAEASATQAADKTEHDECSQMVSIVVSDRLVPVTSAKEYQERMEGVARRGDELRGDRA